MRWHSQYNQELGCGIQIRPRSCLSCGKPR